MFHPIYKENQLIFGNPKSQCGIVTLWSHRKNIVKELPPDSFAAVGQLYSASRGLDPLVRNLLANPSITHLMVYGRDLSKSGEILEDFFNVGVLEYTTEHGITCWRVKSSAGNGFIDYEVSIEAINVLRNSVKLLRCASLEELLENVKNIEPVSVRGKSFVFQKKEVSLDFYPSEETSITVRGGTVADVWLKVLDNITRFGTVTETHYDSRQKEIVNFISVVSSENPHQFYVPSFLPCDKEELKRYIPRVLTNKQYPDCNYTYGQRLRDFFGVDQIQAIIDRLAKELESRSAAASLWDPRTDALQKSGTPCLNHIWVRIRKNKVFLTAVIRSNDMFSGWPENAFALRSLQEHIRESVEEKVTESLKLGDLTIISESAHIYEDCWEASREIIEKNLGKDALRLDPRGHFSIEVDNGKITVEHITVEGEFLRKFEGCSMKQLKTFLVKNQAVSSLEHGIYLGAELQKAELALQRPLMFKYTQDQPLVFLQ